MKRILPLLLVSISLLSSCGNTEETSTSSSKGPYYLEVENLHIEWKDLFNQNNIYFVYIYSLACYTCSMLREDVINYALKEDTNMYFVYPEDDIPFTDDETLAKASLGATSIENVYCYVTPTLIEINNGVVVTYLNDYYQIRDIVKIEG